MCCRFIPSSEKSESSWNTLCSRAGSATAVMPHLVPHLIKVPFVFFLPFFQSKFYQASELFLELIGVYDKPFLAKHFHDISVRKEKISTFNGLLNYCV
jgi:hypothetical protein